MVVGGSAAAEEKHVVKASAPKVVAGESAVAERLASALMMVSSASAVVERLTSVPMVAASASAVAEKLAESVSVQMGECGSAVV